MQVRHADGDRDGAACASIYAPFVTDSHVSFEEEPPSAEEFAKRIEQTARAYPWLVAEQDGMVVGYAYACAHHERAAYRWAADVAVYIAPSARSHGVGRLLYETLLGLLAQQGVRVVCAGVTLPNQASVGLHEALGFQPIGVYRRIGWKQGAWRDVAWFQLELAPPGDDPPPELGPPPELVPPPELDPPSEPGPPATLA